MVHADRLDKQAEGSKAVRNGFCAPSAAILRRLLAIVSLVELNLFDLTADFFAAGIFIDEGTISRVNIISNPKMMGSIIFLNFLLFALQDLIDINNRCIYFHPLNARERKNFVSLDAALAR